MDDDTRSQPPEESGFESVAPVTKPMPSGPPITVGSNVAMAVSKGPSSTPRTTSPVPAVVEMRQDQALTTLQDAGFEVQVLLNANTAFPNGTVSHQLPVASAPASPGTKVVIVVSNGPADEAAVKTVLPDVVGMSGDDAKALLTRVQLKLAVIEDYSASVPAGVVFAQEPNARDLAIAPEKKKSFAWLWMLVLLIVLAVGAFFVFAGEGEEVTVPDLGGMLAEEAETVLEDAGLMLGKVTEEVNPDVPEGQIISQDPVAGDMATEGNRVDIVIAQIPGGVEVPDVVGKSVARAQSDIEDEGLIWRVDEVFSDDVAEGDVIAQSPQAGSRVEEGTEVALSVSKGSEPPPNVSIPDLSGLTEAAAEQTLSDAGLNSQSVKAYSDSIPDGDVIAHAPVSGSSVAPGTKVLLFVSQGPKPPDIENVIVPDVVGMTVDDAKTALEDVGFDVEILEIPNDSVEEGLVVAQMPLGASEAPEGAVVAILVSTGPTM